MDSLVQLKRVVPSGSAEITEHLPRPQTGVYLHLGGFVYLFVFKCRLQIAECLSIPLGPVN